MGSSSGLIAFHSTSPKSEKRPFVQGTDSHAQVLHTHVPSLNNNEDVVAITRGTRNMAPRASNGIGEVTQRKEAGPLIIAVCSFYSLPACRNDKRKLIKIHFVQLENSGSAVLLLGIGMNKVSFRSAQTRHNISGHLLLDFKMMANP